MDRSPDTSPTDVQPTDEIDRLLARLEEGDEDGLHRLFEALYTELHRRARSALGRGSGHTLQPTALVHEAYLRIVRAGGAWRDRRHFLLTASRAMRQLLVDHFRRKRAGEAANLELDQLATPFDERALDLEALDRALVRLAERDSVMAKAVELRFFGGLGVEEVASLLGMSARTLERRWSAVRAWLYTELA